jgi:hypothetical protein
MRSCKQQGPFPDFLASCTISIYNIMYGKNYMRGLQYNLTRMNSLLIRTPTPTHTVPVYVHVFYYNTDRFQRSDG